MNSNCEKTQNILLLPLKSKRKRKNCTQSFGNNNMTPQQPKLTLGSVLKSCVIFLNNILSEKFWSHNFF